MAKKGPKKVVKKAIGPRLKNIFEKEEREKERHEETRLERIIDIHRKVDKFLGREAVSTRGWADITPDEVEDLRDLVDLLIKTKCQRDPDGDLPVEYIIIDRRHFERMHFVPVPYDRLKPDRLERAMEIAELNLSIAHNSFNTKFKIWRYDRREGK